MECELIQEGEDMLFDDSTNPSLKYADCDPLRDRSPLRSRGHRDVKRSLQKAEFIPEEDEVRQLG